MVDFDPCLACLGYVDVILCLLWKVGGPQVGNGVSLVLTSLCLLFVLLSAAAGSNPEAVRGFRSVSFADFKAGWKGSCVGVVHTLLYCYRF